MASAAVSSASDLSQALPTVNPHSTAPDRFINLGIAFLCITWIAVTMRVSVRAVMIRSFGIDDWFMLLTMGTFTTACIFMVVMGMFEKDPHVNTLPNIERLVSYIIGFSGFYCISTVFLKISLALFLLRVVIQGWQRYTIYIILVVYTIIGTFYTFIVVFRCGDPAQYLIHQATGKCLDEDVIQSLAYFQTSTNAVTDLIYAILPIFIIRESKLPPIAKISSCLLLALGTVGGIASVVRLKYIKGLQPGPDFFNSSVNIAIWSLIEPGLGITAASLATLRPLLKACGEKTRSMTPGLPTLGSGSGHGIGSQLRPKIRRPTFSEHGSIQMMAMGMNQKTERAGFQRFDYDNYGKGRTATTVSTTHEDVV